MKSCDPVLLPFLLTCLSGILLIPGVSRGYDAPDFDYDLFSADGIFFEKSEQESLLEALASIASNFHGQSNVDDDLREKAVFIALNIEPLHYNSRLAHLALSRGEIPESTSYFVDSLSAVSEALWTASSHLRSRPIEPEHGKLVPYLMEISLTIHPDPPIDRLKDYAKATRGRELQWSKFTQLDPITNKSTVRSNMLFKEAQTHLSSPSSPKKSPSGQSPPDSVTTNEKIPDKSSVVSSLADFEPISRSVASVRYVDSEPGLALAGQVTLTIRLPENASERELFLLPPGADPTLPPPLPLFASSEGDSLTMIEVPREFANIHKSWTLGTVGEFLFETDGALPVGKTELRFPAMVLLKAALTGAVINPDIILAGDFTANGSPLILNGPVNETIEAARQLEQPYLMLPESARDDLLSYLRSSERLELLFGTELIAFSSRYEVVNRTISPTLPGWLEASEAFAEIEAVSGKMALADLARNARVQERLQGILELVPNHISAWAMLEFGKEPASNGIETDGTSQEIARLIQPYFELRSESPDINTLRQNFEAAEIGLSRLRRNVPLELRSYLSSAEDALQIIEPYLYLSNRDTSTATQKLGDVNEALARVATERAKLGLSPPEI
tara:strand:+ start:5667 stop:7523 length:1857 start_codon:yes stop_codon:yes gene_type:complete